MATGYELIYDIKEKLGLNSDDATFSNEFILFQIEKARTALIKRNYSGGKYRTIPGSLRQHIQLNLQLTADNEFDTNGLDTVLESTVALPIMIESDILNLSILLDGGSYTDLKFQLIPIERFPYAGLDLFLPAIVYAALDYDYKLKIRSAFNRYKLITKIRLYGVFMHPEEAWKLNPNYDSSIDFLTLEYPLDSETLFEVCNVVAGQLLPLKAVPKDKINNADDV